MAEYHEDTVEKHEITKEEILFLKELQKEMNTQDTICQADPRFWVVATDKYEDIGNIDSCDGIQLYDYNNSEVICEYDIPSIINYINEHYENELKDNGITFINVSENECTVLLSIHDVEKNEIEEDEEILHDTDDVFEFLQEKGFLCNCELLYYRYRHHKYPDTMFLTNKSCKEHIKANYYHYNSDAHSYAMTAWRSPEVEKLFKILQEVDWDKIL